MAKLTNKQRVFVETYLKCWNATEAARVAGYKHPHVQGSQNLAKLSIKAAIDARLAELKMGADEVLIRLAGIARLDLGDFFEVHSNGLAMLDLDKAKKADKMRLLKKIKIKENSIEIETYDKQAALVTLAKHLGLFKEHTTIDVSIEIKITQAIRDGKITPDELEKELGSDLARHYTERAGITPPTGTTTITPN